MPWIVIFLLVSCLIAAFFMVSLVFGIYARQAEPAKTFGTLSEVQVQVARLFELRSSHSELFISDQVDRPRLTIKRRGDVACFEFYFHTEWEAARENRVRALFAEEGIPTTEDNIFSHEYRYGSTRHLSYNLPIDVAAITRFAVRILREIERFEEGDTLTFVLWAT